MNEELKIHFFHFPWYFCSSESSTDSSFFLKPVIVDRVKSLMIFTGYENEFLINYCTRFYL